MVDLQNLRNPHNKNNKAPAKKVKFPNYVQDQARYYAQVECDLEGLSYPKVLKGSDYEKAFHEHAYKYLSDAYQHSLTPSGQIGRNPSSPKIAKIYFDQLLGFLDKTLNKSSIDVKNAKRRFRGGVAMITHLLLNGKHGLQIKSRGGKISDFEHRPDASPSDKLTTSKNQYFRILVATLLTLRLEDIFTSDQIKLDGVFNDEFLPDLKDDMTDDQIYKMLHKKDTRLQFVKKVREAYKEGRIDLSSNNSTKVLINIPDPKANPRKRRSAKKKARKKKTTKVLRR